MQFALFGNHADGMAMAKALVATDRHRLIAVCGVAVPDFSPDCRSEPDIEEVLANPAIDLVIVAGPLAAMGEQLRRAVQSERHVLCVHPCAEKPDLAYEVSMIQAETKKALLPLLPGSLHPALSRWRELAKGFQLLTWTRCWRLAHEASPAWDLLRFAGGEIGEVCGFAAEEEWNPAEPLLIHGRFENGGLLQGSILHGSGDVADSLSARGVFGEVAMSGPDARGAATLRWRTADGKWTEELWSEWDAWTAFVPVVETACENLASLPRIGWPDAIHALELDDALRRSVEKRRPQSLDYREITEEVGARGTLTLIGCGMIWLMLLVFGLSVWVPWIRWAIVPMLGGFLLLLAMQWLARRPSS